MASQRSTDPAIKSYHLIFNPASGQGESAPRLATIKAALESVSDLTIHVTEPDLGARALAQRAVDRGADVVIAAGGDGTVSGVASALAHTPIPLGIIPAGTVNAFATAIGIPSSLTEACQLIPIGHPRRVDTARCNDRTMLLIACVGFEADLLSKLDREEKQHLRRLAVVRNSLEELQEVQPFVAHLETPDHTWRESAISVTVANAVTLGMVLAHGPAHISAVDGLLDITLITPDHRWEIVTSVVDLFLSALQQRAVHSETVRSCKATQMTLETDSPQAVFVDGEAAGQTPITLQCHPQSLTVLVPPGA